MALPTAYTEAELAAFMRNGVLKHTATVLGWDNTGVDGDYQEAVNETLVAYGVSDIAQATDITKLRVLARVAVWRAVVDATPGLTDYSADGYQSSRSQIRQGAWSSLREALRDANAAGYINEAVSGTTYSTIIGVF